jgi:hypothetical protein
MKKWGDDGFTAVEKCAGWEYNGGANNRSRGRNEAFDRHTDDSRAGQGNGMKGDAADLRVAEIERRAMITTSVNGRPVQATPGETVLAALTAAGYKAVKRSNVRGEARGPFCGMGVCYECLVTIDGVPKRRACMVEVAENMEIILDEPSGN